MDRDSHVSRRSVLKRTGSSAVILSGYATSSVVAGRGSRKTSINILAEGEKAVKSVQVGKKWYSHTQKAHRVNRQIREHVNNNPGVLRCILGKGDERLDGLRSHEVQVVVEQDDARVKNKIPSSVEGIPVRVVEGNQIRRTGCTDSPDGDCYREIPDKVFGGLACQTDNTKSDSAYGTTCCRVFLNGQKYLMTARHLFTSDLNECNFDSLPTDYEQYLSLNESDGGTTTSEIIGTPQHDFPDSDAALVDASVTDLSITNDISSIYQKGIAGRVTADGLDYIKSNSQTIEKRGRCSCSETGYIKATGGYRACTVTNHIKGLVKSTPDQLKKDSGGVVFYDANPDDDKLYLVNIAMGNPDDGTYDTLGTSGAYLNSSHDVTFGGNPYSG